MDKKLEQIYNFRFPRWDELPNNIFNGEIVEYFNSNFGVILEDDERLTKSMIQNYVKWKMIPAPKGRKYSRDQIARIVVICIFKKVLSIKEISEGVELQNKLMGDSQAYDILVEKLERAIKKVFGPVINKNGNEIYFEEYYAKHETIGMSAIVASLAFKMLGTYIISKKGYKNII